MADRYWVGGTATWDATAGTKWATTSGGAGGAAVPTSSDNVFFDAASGSVTVTTSGTTTDICDNLDFTGFTGTLSHAANTTIGVYGSLTLVSGMTYTRGNVTTSRFSFLATATGKTIDFGGKAPGNITFDGVGGGWTLNSSYTNGSSAWTLTNGALDINGQTISINTLVSSNTNTRSLTLGAASITTVTWDISDSTNMTFSGASSTITYSLSTGTVWFYGGGLTYGTLSATGLTTGSMTITGNNTFSTLTLNGGTSDRGRYIFGGNQTVTGTFTANGNGLTQRSFYLSSASGTARTISAATVSTQYSDWMDITGAGAGSWDLSAITGNSGDCGGNSGITFTTPANQYWVPSAGTSTGSESAVTRWANASGGTAGTGRSPLPQDTAYFDANSIDAAARTITQDKNRVCAHVWTNVTNTPQWTVSATSPYYIGSQTLVAGMTTSSGSTATFAGRGTPSITCAGNVLFTTLTVDNGAGNLTIADAHSMTGLTMNNGTVTLGATLTLSGALIVNGGTISGASYDITGGTTVSNTGGTVTVKGLLNTTTHSYTGGTTTVGSSGMSGTTLTVNGGTLTLNGNSTGMTGAVTLTSGTFNLNADYTTSSNTFSHAGSATMPFNITDGTFTAGTTIAITGAGSGGGSTGSATTFVG